MPLVYAVQLFGEAVEHLALSEAALPARVNEAYFDILHVNNDGMGPAIPAGLFEKVEQLKRELKEAQLKSISQEVARRLIREILELDRLLQKELTTSNGTATGN